MSSLERSLSALWPLPVKINEGGDQQNLGEDERNTDLIIPNVKLGEAVKLCFPQTKNI